MSIAAVVSFDPLRDKRYQQTRLGRDVADFLAWLELGGASPRTLDQYERDLARGALMWPEKGWAELSDGDAIQIAKAFKPGERRVRVAAWRSFARWALRTRRIERNPFDVLPAIKRPQQRVYDIFTDAECELLRGLSEPDGTLMAILLDAGLRKSEARHMQLRHYRPDPSEARPWGSLVVIGGKGGKDRTIRATERVASGIARMHITEGLRDRDFLWYGHRANEVSRRVIRSQAIGDGTFARWWARCLDDAGVRYRNPHMTRHTFATNWLRAGRSLERLSKAMGHGSYRTTADLYAHLDDGDLDVDFALIEGGA